MTVGDDDIEEYYEKNKAQYSQPESRDVRHILVKTKAQADDLYTQLENGANFAALAKKFSEDTGSKANGGKLTISKGQTVAPFDQTAFLLKKNDISKPVKTEFGYHIIQPLSDDEAREGDSAQGGAGVDQAAAGADAEERGDDEVGRRPEEGLQGQGRLRHGLHARRRTSRTRPPGPSSRLPLSEALEELQQLTRRLRRDCPWDREQTARTIVPHTVEEAYEVADAAEAGDPAKLLDELGDLLFQVYFLALLLEEQGEGDLEQVARAVHAKLVRRHPHVFGEVEADTAGRVRERWEQVKSEQEGREGIFHDVPASLPALLQARKLQRRAVAAGFDWPDLEGPLAKVREELGELEAEVARTGEPSPETEADAKVAHEVGDVLFTIVNLARRLNVDPELALRGTNTRFVERVERAEQLAAARGERWSELPLAEQDRYYDEAKEQLG